MHGLIYVFGLALAAQFAGTIWFEDSREPVATRAVLIALVIGVISCGTFALASVTA